MSYFVWVPRCAICRNSVNLAVSKTDEYGRAVHENCYVWSLLSKRPTTAATSASGMSAAHAGPVATRRSFLGGPLLG